MLRFVMPALVATAVLAACTPVRPAGPAGSPDAAGISVHTVSSGGVQRTYRLYRPAGLTGPAPLVLMLHGGFGSGAQAEKSYGWDEQADAGHFLVAYPDGLDRAWNAGGGCCGRPGRNEVDDVAFLAAVVTDIGAWADPARVYATGISNGGMMAYTLACRTTLLAAIAPDSATMLDPCADPAPVSVLHIHGTADKAIPYDGSPGAGVARIDGPPVPEVVARWRAIDGCPAAHTTTTGPLTTATADCPGGRGVELITIAGAGHQWPGSASPRSGADPPSAALDATSTIWRFFAAKRRG